MIWIPLLLATLADSEQQQARRGRVQQLKGRLGLRNTPERLSGPAGRMAYVNKAFPELQRDPAKAQRLLQHLAFMRIDPASTTPGPTDRAIVWLAGRIASADPGLDRARQGQARTIRDWLHSPDSQRFDLLPATWSQALDAAVAWHNALSSESAGDRVPPGRTIFTWPDGWTLQALGQDMELVQLEGGSMQNCLAEGYYSEEIASQEFEVFSLRMPPGPDGRSKPVVTLGVEVSSDDLLDSDEGLELLDDYIATGALEAFLSVARSRQDRIEDLQEQVTDKEAEEEGLRDDIAELEEDDDLEGLEDLEDQLDELLSDLDELRKQLQELEAEELREGGLELEDIAEWITRRPELQDFHAWVLQHRPSYLDIQIVEIKGRQNEVPSPKYRARTVEALRVLLEKVYGRDPWTAPLLSSSEEHVALWSPEDPEFVLSWTEGAWSTVESERPITGEVGEPRTFTPPGGDPRTVRFVPSSRTGGKEIPILFEGLDIDPGVLLRGVEVMAEASPARALVSLQEIREGSGPREVPPGFGPLLEDVLHEVIFQGDLSLGALIAIQSLWPGLSSEIQKALQEDLHRAVSRSLHGQLWWSAWTRPGELSEAAIEDLKRLRDRGGLSFSWPTFVGLGGTGSLLPIDPWEGRESRQLRVRKPLTSWPEAVALLALSATPLLDQGGGARQVWGRALAEISEALARVDPGDRNHLWSYRSALYLAHRALSKVRRGPSLIELLVELGDPRLGLLWLETVPGKHSFDRHDPAFDPLRALISETEEGAILFARHVDQIPHPVTRAGASVTPRGALEYADSIDGRPTEVTAAAAAGKTISGSLDPYGRRFLGPGRIDLSPWPMKRWPKLLVQALQETRPETPLRDTAALLGDLEDAVEEIRRAKVELSHLGLPEDRYMLDLKLSGRPPLALHHDYADWAAGRMSWQGEALALQDLSLEVPGYHPDLKQLALVLLGESWNPDVSTRSYIKLPPQGQDPLVLDDIDPTLNKATSLYRNLSNQLYVLQLNGRAPCAAATEEISKGSSRDRLVLTYRSAPLGAPRGSYSRGLIVERAPEGGLQMISVTLPGNSEKAIRKAGLQEYRIQDARPGSSFRFHVPTLLEARRAIAWVLTGHRRPEAVLP